MKNYTNVPFTDVTLKDGFWKSVYDRNKNVSVESVKKVFEYTGRFDAMRFNFIKTAKTPHIFYDSDVAKWIEAVAYIMLKDRDSMKENEVLIDDMVDCMEKAQRDDGYLNSTTQQIAPQLKFKDRSRHELYCAGHFIEAAIAYHQATGKEKLLNIMERYCDLIYRVFAEEKSAAFFTPGHEEIELALYKLYRYRNNEKYRKLAEFFLENRGKHKEAYLLDNPYTSQDNADIYHLKSADGHSVRALYLYCGMADYALDKKDSRLEEVLRGLFADITERKMYITGGVGSAYQYEGFTVPYDLPNAAAYSESCCAIAFILFALRMRKMRADAKYGALVERVMYNALLSPVSADGKKFFYENPLEIRLADKHRLVGVKPEDDEHHPLYERKEAFSCSCCPPNINRFFAEIGDVVAFADDDRLTIEQYVSSQIKTPFGNVEISEEYATKGRAEISSDDYSAQSFAVRIPEWCSHLKATLDSRPVHPEIENGYAVFRTGKKFRLSLDFDIRPVFVCANPLVSDNAGKTALTYGPVVYCLEGKDNGSRLSRISVDTDAADKATVCEKDGLTAIIAYGYRDNGDDRLYFPAAQCGKRRKRLTFIPYYAFANRGESDMAVWIRKA